MISVEISADLVQIQVREKVCGVFLVRMDIPIQVWHMVDVMHMVVGFQRTSYKASTHNSEPTWRNANDGGKRHSKWE